uniref:Uncharacterized protein n=1 Tax=Klebsiella phage FKP3 TaxID=3231233 RepID=A0AAU8HZR4_9CAUD
MYVYTGYENKFDKDFIVCYSHIIVFFTVLYKSTLA